MQKRAERGAKGGMGKGVREDNGRERREVKREGE